MRTIQLRNGCAAIDHGVECPAENETLYMGRFRVDGSWEDTLEHSPVPLAANITRREIALQAEVHRE
jgi:hypothetical protein